MALWGVSRNDSIDSIRAQVRRETLLFALQAAVVRIAEIGDSGNVNWKLEPSK